MKAAPCPLNARTGLWFKFQVHRASHMQEPSCWLKFNSADNVSEVKTEYLVSNGFYFVSKNKFNWELWLYKLMLKKCNYKISVYLPN